MLWLLHYRQNDGRTIGIIKCAACQEMRVDFRWGTCIDCKILQKSLVKVHEKSVDHINLITR